MGFMTELSISNDNWHRLKEMILEDPKRFTDEIDVLMNGRPQYRYEPGADRPAYLGSKESDEIHVPGTVGYSTVYRSHHADEAALYLAYHGSFQRLDKYTIQAEYGDRIENPHQDDRLLDILIERVEAAQEILRKSKDYLTTERQKHEVAKMLGQNG